MPSPRVKMLTGELSGPTPGHPLNCHVGPATSTATTCFLGGGGGGGEGGSGEGGEGGREGGGQDGEGGRGGEGVKVCSCLDCYMLRAILECTQS